MVLGGRVMILQLIVVCVYVVDVLDVLVLALHTVVLVLVGLGGGEQVVVLVEIQVCHGGQRQEEVVKMVEVINAR